MKLRWTRTFAAMTMATCAIATAVAAPPAVAQSAVSAAQVIALAVRGENKTAFKGIRVQQVVRQDMVLHANAKIDFSNAANYQIAIDQPKEIQGLNLVLDQNKLTAFFPKENLLFQSDAPAGSEEAKDLILGNLTDDPAALARNYKVTVAPELDVVALYPCYKLTVEPAKGLGPTAPPGRRYWIAKENGLVMKEERYWSDEQAAFFISQYNTFSTAQKPAIKLTIPREVSKLKLAKGSPTNMVRYPSLEAARAAGKPVWGPAVVPDGFKLQAVDVMSLYGTDIVIIRYHDGANNMAVTYRTKENSFLTLMAGAFALSLVEKISALSYHAPNNYAVIEKNGFYVYAYGDLWVENLKNVANSVPVPTAPAAPKQGAAGMPQFAIR